ncbi:MAG: hypothetical protein ABIQ95_05660 [Bdellovibrionia bacterium]
MLLRLLSLIVVVSFLPVLLGFAISESSGAFIGLIFSLLIIASVAMTSEKTISQIYGAHSRIPEGLEQTLNLVLEGAGSLSPRILIYSDSYPNALVVRQIGGRGSILMSQGMVALLNDMELREVMKMCLARLKERTLLFQSLSSVFAVGVFGLIPSAWSKLVFIGQTPTKSEKTELGPFSTLVFLILFPIVQFFLYAGTSPRTFSILKKRTGTENTYSSAVQKMGRLIPLFGKRLNHGTACLSIMHF